MEAIGCKVYPKSVELDESQDSEDSNIYFCRELNNISYPKEQLAVLLVLGTERS